MSKSDLKFSELEANVKALIQKLISTQEELNILKKENLELKKLTSEGAGGIAIPARSSAANTENLKKKLDLYISEVEECMRLVQKI